MASDQLENNYMNDLAECLHKVFDEAYISFDLRNTTPENSFVSVLQGGVSQVLANKQYVLAINVDVSIAALNKKSHKEYYNSIDVLAKGYIGTFRPVHVEQYRQVETVSHVFRFTYEIRDLDEFMGELKKHSWRLFNARMDKEISEVIGD